MSSRRPRSRTLLCALLLALLPLASCNPSKRESHDVRLSVANFDLTSGRPMQLALLRLSDDPFFAEHQEDLDQISEIRLEISVGRNGSSRLKLGIHVSDEQETRLGDTTKIADYNVLPGGSPSEPVRVSNVGLRNLLLGDEFFFYVVGEGQRIDVHVNEITLVVTAEFIN